MSSDTEVTSTADVVVVGSGSAGAVVARRLVDAGASVLLLEAGLPDDNPAIHDPARLFELWDSEQDWGYRTVPQAACAGRELHWPRGRVLGGSSALNGMIYVRGHRGDYDGWAARGNDGWGYDDVLPLFKRSEDFDRGADEYHGAGGPLSVITRYEPHPVTAAAVEAAQEAGVPFNDDSNGAELEGVAFCQLNIRDGRRHSVAEAFLRPVLDAQQPHGADLREGVPAPLRGRQLCRGGVRAGRSRAAGAGRARGRRLRGHDRVAKAADALGDRPGGRPSAAGHRAARRPPRRRREPARPRARPGDLLGAGRGAAAGARPPAAPRASVPAVARRARAARPPAALLPPPALRGGPGRAAGRLHAHGRRDPARQPRLAAPGVDGPRRPAAARPGLPVERRGPRGADRRGRALPRDRTAAGALGMDARGAVSRRRRPRRRRSSATTSGGTRSPTTTRSGRAGWASTSWPWSIRSSGCGGWTGCASPTPR